MTVVWGTAASRGGWAAPGPGPGLTTWDLAAECAACSVERLRTCTAGEMKNMFCCVSAGYLLHLGGGGAEELYVPRPDDLLVLQQRLHGEEISRYCHLISNCKNIM